MWTWVTEDRAEADRMLSGILAPMLRRNPGELQVCVGSAEHCAELWPLGDEARQVERIRAAANSA